MSRVFVGLGLSDEARRGVEKVVKKLKRAHWKVKWEKPEKWHVTLAFLGSIDQKQLEKVKMIVRETVRMNEGFELGLKGLGAFPDLFLPKLLWLGLNGDLKSMYALQKGLKVRLEKEGFDLGKGKFQPHVTLGRVSRNAGRKERIEVGKYISKNLRIDTPQTWLIDKVMVYESVLHHSGSEYRSLGVYNLSAYSE